MRRILQKRIRPVLCVLALAVRLAPAHEWRKHSPQKTPSESRGRLYGINNSYVKHIRPIFNRKCFDCHREKTIQAWIEDGRSLLGKTGGAAAPDKEKRIFENL